VIHHIKCFSIVKKVKYSSLSAVSIVFSITSCSTNSAYLVPFPARKPVCSSGNSLCEYSLSRFRIIMSRMSRYGMAYQTDVSVIVAVLFISWFWYWYQYQFGPVFQPFFFSPDVDAYPVQEIDSTLSRCLPQFCWNSVTSR